jgi:copper/silver efflux system protein
MPCGDRSREGQAAIIEPGAAPGVKMVTAYDRSELILRSIDNLKHTLIEEIDHRRLVILIFLWHIPSASFRCHHSHRHLIAFIPMKAMGLTSNIMSLGGIAIAIGAMVDAAIVVVEQTHKKLEEWERGGRKEDYTRGDRRRQGSRRAQLSLRCWSSPFRSCRCSTLEAQEGSLFKPLAYTKNFSMIVAAVLAITLDPAMRLLFTHMKNFSFRPRWLARVTNAVLVGKSTPEEKHPISRVLIKSIRARVRNGRAALEVGGDRGAALVVAYHAGVQRWARSSCRRSMKARCSTCLPRCRAFRSPKRSGCCRSRIASSKVSGS